MPTGDVISRNFKDIFSNPVRYEIPFFQRGYAWEQRQWKKLFEDIQTQVIESVSNNKFEEEEHFFGPVVVLEKISNHPSIKRFLIIDGQQRITTSYLLLAVIKRLLESKSHLSTDAQAYIAELDVLLVNDVKGSDDYLKLKVFSTKGDRLPTYKAIFSENPSSPFLSDDQLLYNPESNKIDAFIQFAWKQLRYHDIQQLWQIYQAVIKSLKIVWIPLDERKDDAQAIFESLNDAGMPLSASELLCNYIFRPLTNEATNEHEKLHNEKWLAARRKVGENVFEEYLRDLFSIGEKKTVGKERRMYVHYKNKYRKLTSESARATLDQILNYANVYNTISKPAQFPPSNVGIKKLLISINNTNMFSIYPFLLALMKAHETGSISETNTIALLNETYVLLVRRKITSLPVTKYDTFFPSLLDKIIREENIIRAFHKQLDTEQLWVSDQSFEDAFIHKEIYNSRELNFTRLILQEVDKDMQNFGELPDYSTIYTVEHVLPQTLDDHWRVYLGLDVMSSIPSSVVNSIGNLTLNSQSSNSHNSQNPFHVKQVDYTEVSALSRDIKRRKEPWNILAIHQRSKDLAKIALTVWKWSISI